MNVIITRDKSVRLTQQSHSAYNIQDIVFYLSKTLSYTDIELHLKKNRNTYPFVLDCTGEITNYKIYKVIFTQPISLSQREYDLALLLDYSEILDIGSFLIQAIKIDMPVARLMTLALDNTETTPGTAPFGLTDQHEPVDIIDRDIIISNNQNILIAEDNISQCITFRLPRYYDGVDLMSKYLYLDYIDIETTIDEFGKTITKDKLINLPLNHFNNTFNNDYVIVDPVMDPITGAITEYLRIPWTVPYEVTKVARTISFALSAMDSIGSETTDPLMVGQARQYIWQTKPANLIVQKNLFKRNSVPVNKIEGTDAEQIAQRLDTLDDTTAELVEDVTEIKESDIYLLDPEKADSEITLSGGNAPIEEV